MEHKFYRVLIITYIPNNLIPSNNKDTIKEWKMRIEKEQ